MIDDCLAVEFRLTDDDCPLAAVSRDVDAAIDAGPPQRRSDGYDLLQFEAPTSERLTDALEADGRLSYLHVSRLDGRSRYRCLSRQPCVVHSLIDHGLIVETLRYGGGVATVSGAVVGRDVLEGVMAAAGETVGVQLARAHPMEAEDREPTGERWDLTPAQTACLRTALEMGYFEIPRETSSEAVADELGISKSAFLDRLRRAEASLCRQVFAYE